MMVTLAPSIAAAVRIVSSGVQEKSYSVAFGSDVMRFKQAFSGNADIGEGTEYRPIGHIYGPNVRPSQATFGGCRPPQPRHNPPAAHGARRLIVAHAAFSRITALPRAISDRGRDDQPGDVFL